MKFHHTAITVNSLEESIQFYQDIFGCSVDLRFEKPEMKVKGVLLILGDVRIELFEFQEMKENRDDLADLKIRGIRHLAFEVENIEEEVSKLQKRNIPVEEIHTGSTGNRYCFFSDPNGVSIEFYQYFKLSL